MNSQQDNSKPVLIAGCLVAILSGFTMLPLLGSGQIELVALFLIIELFLMGATFAPMGALLPELFPTNVRPETLAKDAELKTEWKPDLLGGVMVIKGSFTDGSPMMAIPNYTRMNRVEPPKELAAGDPTVNYAPGATGATPAVANNVRRNRTRTVSSKVWIQI